MLQKNFNASATQHRWERVELIEKFGHVRDGPWRWEGGEGGIIKCSYHVEGERRFNDQEEGILTEINWLIDVDPTTTTTTTTRQCW